MSAAVQRIKAKEDKLKALKSQCEELDAKYNHLCSKFGIELTPQALNEQNIKKLKLYNELRDTGLRMVQVVADEKQCRLKDVFDEMGFEMND
ncbi:ADR293C-Ap [Eremothecium gossypii ATCC 10895]|uniref:ADR293C-Ap n=1 Tax=Eremothecium gossypii (strain ATCC 10895 / CBS 109.51 / FGSC 9923 / NRRL Y-1056) TaxID=284811 RepID=Q759H1_EREGS|nr:ADR293C-Ap [Eremothecium gossypii ATCC 10895]AAS52214.1 ADR293C-Ap [Eremothecium gossypii ATCC 10895]AEY96513.1 FADR293C-Ap [Eremothecium gossypii FDAG1]